MKHKTLRTVLDLLPIVMLLLGGLFGLLDYLFIGGGTLAMIGGIMLAVGIVSIFIPMPYSKAEEKRYSEKKNAHDLLSK
ncbi:hypothetical protein BM526_19270 (plasmid) [Alteromonas mediterranea]|uniref:hypothetical protein n=1 Tax=Alteromonas mediterranea TaxID=314275 RepID=UPI0009041551|nr:hypothetical protein [Alteromonas mediterranea]APE04111.1 hypothetical protein BM526_19270 [Alteromonas mediterranea]